jgi:hypothetical protein
VNSAAINMGVQVPLEVLLKEEYVLPFSNPREY